MPQGDTLHRRQRRSPQPKGDMLLSKAAQRGLVSGATVAVSTARGTEKEAATGKSSSPLSLLPVAILFLSGLVASRLLDDATPSSPTGLVSPGPLTVDVGQQQAPGLDLKQPGVQCHGWCLSRGTFTTAEQLQHCYQQCLAHPEVQRFYPALEASAGAAAGTNRTLLFAAWYAEGERGPEGHDSHQLKKPDTSFISALHASHPGARVALLTDQATQIELPPEVRVFRYTLDRSKLGRNAYANYYQYLAQISFMRALMSEGLGDNTDIVFLDMDVLVVDSLGEVFAQGAPFDYGVTLSDAVDMPVNLGMQFVPAGRYSRAIAFLDDVLAVYPFNETFIAGQVALSSLVGILHNGPEVLSRVNGSVVDGRSCKLVAGAHTVCFFPCMRYNYCHHDQSCCTDPRRLPVSLTSLDELLGARVKVLHFVGPRKKVLGLVHKAFMGGGLEGAYRMLSMLPHTEAELGALDVAAAEATLLPLATAAAASAA